MLKFLFVWVCMCVMSEDNHLKNKKKPRKQKKNQKHPQLIYSIHKIYIYIYKKKTELVFASMKHTSPLRKKTGARAVVTCRAGLTKGI